VKADERVSRCRSRTPSFALAVLPRPPACAPVSLQPSLHSASACARALKWSPHCSPGSQSSACSRSPSPRQVHRATPLSAGVAVEWLPGAWGALGHTQRGSSGRTAGGQGVRTWAVEKAV
jgi:hypothetical protein